MGLRSCFIEIKSKEELISAYFLNEALDSVADYAASYGQIIVAAMKWNEKLFLGLMFDGSSAFEYLSVFSPNFLYYSHLENLPNIKGRVIGAKYMSLEAFEAEVDKLEAL